MRGAVAPTLLAGIAVAGAQGASRLTGRQLASPPAGQYFFSHAAGHDEFTGGFTLHGSSISAPGITTNLLACTRPPSKQVRYPGPPDNWQPQKTIPVSRHGANLAFSYAGSFPDRISGYPQSLETTARSRPPAS